MRDRVTAALQDAMRMKDPTRVATLRLMLAAITDRDIAARTGEEGPTETDEAALLALLKKMIRQREESAVTYEEAGRLDIAERERAEIATIREFLPSPMSAGEIDAAVDAAIADLGASGIRDMGRVMAALKAAYAGRMDFGAAGQRVRSVLA